MPSLSPRTALFLLLTAALPAQTRYRIDTVAGNPAMPEDVPATSVALSGPISVVPDNTGGFYFNDFSRFRIRYVSPAGVIRTVAGTGTSGPSTDGVPAKESAINDANSLVLAANGDLYFSESFTCRVSRVDTGGILRFVAGTGTCGYSGDGGPALAAQLRGPQGLAFDAQGRLLISDTNNSRIRRVNTDGTIETIAGTGNSQTFSPDGTAAAQTPVSFPLGLAAAADGTIYFVEFGYRRVRRIAPDGRVFTVAGSGADGNTGDGGPAVQARFRSIRYIALDAPRGRLLIADAQANRIRSVALGAGTIAHAVGITFPSAIVFANSFSGDNGAPGNAGLANPLSIAVDSAGAIYIADESNNRIRRADSVIRTVAGRFRNSADGPAKAAELLNPNALAFTPAGELLISDGGNRLIRRVTGANITTIAGVPEEKLPANTAASSTGDGSPALAAGFQSLNSIAADAAGRIYINDGNRLRRIEAGNIASVGLGAAAVLPGVTHFAADSTRNRLYGVAPSSNKVLVADTTQNVLVFRDFAGTGTAGFAGDGGAASAAQLNAPSDVAVDSAGNVYIADTNRIRRVTPAGVISTVAGTGSDLTERPGAAETAALSTNIDPLRLAVDAAGRVVFTEGASSPYLRQWDPATNRIRPIAGGLRRGQSGDGGLALGAQISAPGFIRIDPAGNIYFVEQIESTVRVLRPLVLSRFEAVSGDAQTGAAGTVLPAPLVVRVATADGPIAGVTVSFTATAGATANPSSVVTGADGLARTELTLGGAAGPVTVTAAVEGLTAVTFRATATTAVVVNPNRPAIRGSGGVATAGAFGGSATIAPGTWMEIYGTNLAGTTRPWGDADFRGAQAPVELDGVRVSVGGRSAFVAFISPTQINVQVPDGIGTGAVAVTVTNSNGTSEAVNVTAAAAAPALLAPPVFAVGGVQYVAALHQDGAFVGRPNLIAGANFRPAKTGDVITLYGVGFGAVAPAVAAGQVTPATASLPAVTIRVGDREAQVLYGGLAPGAVGLYQFNLVMPAGTGDLPLVVTSAGASSQRLTITGE